MKKLLLITLLIFNALSFQAKAVLTQQEKEQITDRFLENASEKTRDFLKIEILSDDIFIYNPYDENYELLFKDMHPATVSNITKSFVFIKNNFTELCASLTWIKDLSLIGWNNLQLPINFGNLTNLKELCLNKNKIQTLPNSFSKLTALKELELCNNNIKIFPKEIEKLINLKSLYLSKNNIQILPNNIRKLYNLEKLCLSYNNLTSLPEGIGQLSSLKTLNLSSNQNLRVLPGSLRNLARSLVLLDLSGTNIPEFGEGETLGKHELRAIFGDRFDFGNSYRKRKQNIITEISIDDAFNQHNKNPLHFNIDCLKNCVLADLPITNLTGDSMLE